ncbi:hypothetical protein U9Y61_22415, partial [Escherichia coli]
MSKNFFQSGAFLGNGLSRFALNSDPVQLMESARASAEPTTDLNRPGFPGECFICELRLPDHRFRWKHNKLFLLLPEEYGPAFPA